MVSLHDKTKKSNWWYHKLFPEFQMFLFLVNNENNVFHILGAIDLAFPPNLPDLNHNLEPLWAEKVKSRQKR